MWYNDEVYRIIDYSNHFQTMTTQRRKRTIMTSVLSKIFVAKSEKEKDFWLPLWMHARDTADIAARVSSQSGAQCTELYPTGVDFGLTSDFIKESADIVSPPEAARVARGDSHSDFKLESIPTCGNIS